MMLRVGPFISVVFWPLKHCLMFWISWKHRGLSFWVHPFHADFLPKSQLTILATRTVPFKRLVIIRFSWNPIYFYINHSGDDIVLKSKECPRWLWEDTGMARDVRRTSVVVWETSRAQNHHHIDTRIDQAYQKTTMIFQKTLFSIGNPIVNVMDFNDFY